MNKIFSQPTSRESIIADGHPVEQGKAIRIDNVTHLEQNIYKVEQSRSQSHSKSFISGLCTGAGIVTGAGTVGVTALLVNKLYNAYIAGAQAGAATAAAGPIVSVLAATGAAAGTFIIS